MAREYIDIVIAKIEEMPLFLTAPAFKRYQKGEQVIFEYKDEEYQAVVEQSATVNFGDDEYKTFVAYSELAHQPMCKITKKVSYSDVDWSGYDEEEDKEDE